MRALLGLLMGMVFSLTSMVASAETARVYDQQGSYVGRVDGRQKNGVQENRLYGPDGRYLGRTQQSGQDAQKTRIYGPRGDYKGMMK